MVGVSGYRQGGEAYLGHYIIPILTAGMYGTFFAALEKHKPRPPLVLREGKGREERGEVERD